jgi:hypothetical protein
LRRRRPQVPLSARPAAGVRSSLAPGHAAPAQRAQEQAEQPGVPITPAQALQRHSDQLTAFEQVRGRVAAAQQRPLRAATSPAG